MKQTHPLTEPRYSPAKVILFALFRPVTAVRRGEHLGLGWAWMVHVIGVGLAAAACLLLVVYEASEVYPTLNKILVLTAETLNDVLGELDSPQGWIELFFLVLFIEALVFLFVALAMSWCARDEKILKSYRRAIRRLFLLTPHAATVIALAGGTMIWIERASWPYFFDPFGYDKISLFLIFVTACLWSLWAVLAALGCRSAPAMCRWPGRCEGCGYQLTGLSSDKDCPECGLAIIKTLGPDIRPGVAQSPRRRFVWWVRQTYQSVRRPTMFGKKLHVLSPDPGHRRCLAITIVLLMLASPIAMMVFAALMYWIQWIQYPDMEFDWNEYILVVTMAGIMIGLVLVAFAAGLALGGSVLIGSAEGWRHGRNLMPAAIRAACYQSGFLPFWAGVVWFNITLFFVVDELDLLDSVVLPYNVDIYLLIGLWLFGLAGLGIVIYLFLVGRTTTAARYANW